MSRELVGWAPNQQVFFPLAVRWDDDTEHYIASCEVCEWESPITCDRWHARDMALAHGKRCPRGGDHDPA